MNRATGKFSVALALLAVGTAASAQDVLIRNAAVHTAAASGTLNATDVLVQGGVIRAIGKQLATPAGIAIVDADGAPLTPGLFAGITGIGIEEVSAEPSTNDTALAFGAIPPQVAPMPPEVGNGKGSS